MPSYGAHPVEGSSLVDGPTVAILSLCRAGFEKMTGKETKKEWKQDIKTDKE